MSVPFLDLAAQQAEIADEVLPLWQEVFASSEFIGGPHVEAFEREYAAYVGVDHCIAVANGTDAIELALRAVGVTAGDEVVLPANTFVATAGAVVRLGAVPVLVDVDPDHLLIDPAAVEPALTDRTRAIVPVHLFGQTAPVELLRPVAERHGLTIVEDTAQAQGARSAAGIAGALGDASSTSFYPGKNLGAAGDAGAVLTRDAAVAEHVRSTANHGSTVKYVHDRVGINSRLDAVHAIVLSAKLRRLERWNEARRAAARRYTELLGPVPGVRTPRIRPGNEDVWHLYVAQVDDRDRVLARLHEEGIGAAIHYPTPVHLTDAYAHLGYGAGSFPVAEEAAGRILSLPMHPHLTPTDQDRVVEVLARVVGEGAA
ncbi:MAG: DegT/DnrJ/EryC1/StrS family aminotransferase [Aeromicrobium sp.]